MSTILDTIQATLTTLAADETVPMSGGVFYGMCTAQNLTEWNYFVFNRRKMLTSNSKAYTDIIDVHIVHENYIPENYELTVMDALKDALAGFSPYEDVNYDYVTKGDTDIVVEMATISMKKSRKVDV